MYPDPQSAVIFSIRGAGCKTRGRGLGILVFKLVIEIYSYVKIDLNVSASGWDSIIVSISGAANPPTEPNQMLTGRLAQGGTGSLTVACCVVQ